MVDACPRVPGVIGYLVSFLFGLGVDGLYPMLRRRRPVAVELRAAVQESVTVFGSRWPLWSSMPMALTPPSLP